MKININSKKILKIVTLLVIVLVLTGCLITDPVTKQPVLIKLETTYTDMKNLKCGLFDLLLTYPLAQAINYLSSKFGVFLGISIVTLVLNLILLVFTFKSTESMQKMQMIQPELDRIQKKYEGKDSQTAKVQMSQEMQRLFDQNDVNPLSSLTSLLQLPIFLCMYSAIRSSYEVSNGDFLGASLALTPREAFANGEVVLIVIYICMIVFQLISTIAPQFIANLKKKRLAKIQHKPYEKTKNSNAFMMYGMVVLIGMVMISWPTALSLYYAVVSVINLLKTVAVEIIMQRKESK